MEYNDISKLDEETTKAYKALLEQYKKELSDLNARKGIALTMSPADIKDAKIRLAESIHLLEETNLKLAHSL